MEGQQQAFFANGGDGGLNNLGMNRQQGPPQQQMVRGTPSALAQLSL